MKLPEYEMSLINDCIDSVGLIDIKLNDALNITRLDEPLNLARKIDESTHRISNLVSELQSLILNLPGQKMIQSQADYLEMITYESTILCKSAEELLRKFNDREQILNAVLSITHENLIDLVGVRDLLT